MTQEEGGRHVQFDLGVLPPSGKKEAAVLSDASLSALAREVAPLCTRLAMLLNVPTATLIMLREDMEARSEAETGRTEQTVDAGRPDAGKTDAGKTDPVKVATQYLLYWKRMRAGAKDKDKVSEMERVLREVGKQDAADIFIDRSRENQELTADSFS